MGAVSFHFSAEPFSMPLVFHIIDVNPIWHIFFGRLWIHDHRFVPSSWYECINVAPSKGTNQNRVKGLKNPFYIEEAHFYEASFIMDDNLIKLAREKPNPSSYPVVMNLSNFVKPTVNHPSPTPPKIFKSP